MQHLLRGQLKNFIIQLKNGDIKSVYCIHLINVIRKIAITNERKKISINIEIKFN